jgi:hypothetical protein
MLIVLLDALGVLSVRTGHRPGRGAVRVGGRRARLVTALVLAVWMVLPTSSASGFGTIDSGGQHREHERITRAALSCAGDAPSDVECFQPASIDYLAGHDREFGAVGAPDSDEISVPAAHCDNADFLEASYPRTRDQASAGLVECVDHLRSRFAEGVEDAAGLLDDSGAIVEGEVELVPECRGAEGAEDRAKCASLEALGRVLHGSQDFYAHSNWADEADPRRPLGDDNPPGMNRPGPSPVLDLRAEAPPTIPVELSTGCFVVRDEVPGVGECEQRVTHAALNKDNGLVDPVTGAVSDPTTPRGMVEDNFAQAVAGAIAESRRQWQDFGDELIARYGQDEAELMICALTHDDPTEDCSDRGWVPILLVVLGVGVIVAIVSFLWLRTRHQRRVRSTATL